MKVIESLDFHKQAAKTKELLDSGIKLDPDTENLLWLKVERAETLKKIEDATGLRFAVAEEGMEANTAALVETSSKKAYINVGTLDIEVNTAKKIGHHEENHVKHLNKGVNEVDLKEFLSDEQLEVLANHLGLRKKPEDINWIEGFTELKTIIEHGENDGCVYLQEEVPAAKKLEQLANEYLGKSIIDAFFTGNDILKERLRELCDALMIEDIRANLMAKAA